MICLDTQFLYFGLAQTAVGRQRRCAVPTIHKSLVHSHLTIDIHRSLGILFDGFPSFSLISDKIQHLAVRSSTKRTSCCALQFRVQLTRSLVFTGLPRHSPSCLQKFVHESGNRTATCSSSKCTELIKSNTTFHKVSDSIPHPAHWGSAPDHSRISG